MLQVGQICLLLYSVLLLVGGVAGFLKGKSKVSLISGIGSGILALVGYWLSTTHPPLGLGIGIGVGLSLTVVFLIRFRKTGQFMPAGLLCGLSLIAAVISGLALLQPGT